MCYIAVLSVTYWSKSMKNTNIAQAVDALKTHQPTSRFNAFCVLDDLKFDLNAVFDEAVDGYAKATGVELPEATFILTGRKIESGQFEPLPIGHPERWE